MRRRPPAAGGGGEPPGSGQPRPRRLRRLGVTGLGVVLVWGTLGALGYVGGWQLHARRASGALVTAEQGIARRAATRTGDGLAATGTGRTDNAARTHAGHPGAGSATASHEPCVVTAPQTGQLAGLLVIPAIHLTAPVEEGTSDPVLSVAVGHDPSSVWPGASGTSAFLAHDVSYFVHLGALRPGDTIKYETACSTTTFVVARSQVVDQGTPIQDAATPTLVLDTCYPSNALFFTSQRLLVWAQETATTANPRSGTGPGAVVMPPGDRVAYQVPAPAPLVAQGLTLLQNEAPMGTMSLSGQTSPAWEQSPGPMALEAAALEAYFGGLHAMAQTQVSWWDAIAEPTASPPAPLRGATVTGHDSPLDVTIASAHDVASSVVLTTEITLSGGPAPGTYQESVTALVHGATVLLGAWTLQPA